MSNDSDFEQKNHNYIGSASHSEQKPKKTSSKFLRFVDGKESNSYNSDYEELERQIDDGVSSLKVKFKTTDEGDDKYPIQLENKINESQRLDTGIDTTGAEVNDQGTLTLKNHAIKLKTDNEILNITLRHLQEELNGKSDTIRKQQTEIQTLRQTVLDLQNQMSQSQLQTQVEISSEQQQQQQKLPEVQISDKENTVRVPPKPYSKPLSPREAGNIFQSFGTDQTINNNNKAECNIFKRESIVKPLSKSYATFQLQKDSGKSQVSDYRTQQSSGQLPSFRMKDSTVKSNEFLSREYRQSVKDRDGSLKRRSVMDCEMQMQNFDEEFNKVFNNS